MKDNHQLLRVAGIIFGLVIPLLFTLVYLVLGIVASLALLSALLSGKATLHEILSMARLPLWTLAGWAGLVSLFSILKRRDYYLRPLNLRQIIGLFAGIAAAVPWLIIESTTGFILAGPIIFAIICLVGLKWKIRKSKERNQHPEGL
ncbi:MAG TPA: hypothetical protein VK785_07530 [Opitutaceae bacterium]|jgi:hypothetical protein|nr:hypothetical protein [Opitutaceae bacterium]